MFTLLEWLEAGTVSTSGSSTPGARSNRATFKDTCNTRPDHGPWGGP